MSLDRLYSELSTRVGITRTRDVRLEQIAMDRALEARYQLAMSAGRQLGDSVALIPQSTQITHPIAQLAGRTFPLDAAGGASVGENAAWHWQWHDPIGHAVDAWATSPAHRANLDKLSFRSWGIGFHSEMPPGQSSPLERRWFFITVFAEALAPLTRRRFSVAGGEHTGHQFTARGEILASKTVPIAPRGSGASFDDRRDIPGRGPHLHVVNGAWANYWVPESAAIQAVQL